jgi:hypothetical protein
MYAQDINIQFKSLNESNIIYFIHICLIGNKVVDKYKEYQYLSDIE